MTAAGNTRAACAAAAEKYSDHEPWFGIEQEYTFFKDGRPHGWPIGGYPAPQGGYYCGIGADEIWGRDVVEAHTTACLDAGLAISGTNAEVMIGQWEFQIGPLGPVEVADQVWMARWLLYRIAEDYDISAHLMPKPVKGDWNGAGMHTNFSTAATRNPESGRRSIEEAIERLAEFHSDHIRHYGDRLDERLTGQHETCDINTFKWGIANRGASIRIPQPVALKGYGYLEDRRPGANADPYLVAASLIATVCDVEQAFEAQDLFAIAA